MIFKGWSERIALATGNFAKLFGNSDIPPLPELSTRLLRMCRDESVDIAELGDLLASDVGLSTKVLSVVNSACYGLRQKVTSVSHAISMLGMERVAAVVMGFVVSRQLPTGGAGFKRIAFWQDSIQRAVFAQSIATTIAPSAEAEAFTGALLQDMALPILLNQWSAHYLPIVECAENSDSPLHQVEEERLSWNHAQAGAWMARNWSLPDILVCCIGLHHATFDEAKSLELDKTPVAAVIASSRLPDAEETCCEEIGLSHEQYGQLCGKTDEVCAQMSSLFNVPAPKPLAKSSMQSILCH